MQLERTPLPGVGMRYTLHTRDGRRLGVICHRNGQRELLCYDTGDPDLVERSLSLTVAEARDVADLLHPVTTVDHASGLDNLDGVAVAGVPVTAASTCAGQTLARTVSAVRGVSVIAIVRDGRTIAAPGADLVLTHGDVLVVAGTQESVSALADLLDGGS